jgi:hypothetical protein
VHQEEIILHLNSLIEKSGYDYIKLDEKKAEKPP